MGRKTFSHASDFVDVNNFKRISIFFFLSIKCINVPKFRGRATYIFFDLHSHEKEIISFSNTSLVFQCYFYLLEKPVAFTLNKNKETMRETWPFFLIYKIKANGFVISSLHTHRVLPLPTHWSLHFASTVNITCGHLIGLKYIKLPERLWSKVIHSHYKQLCFLHKHIGDFFCENILPEF